MRHVVVLIAPLVHGRHAVARIEQARVQEPQNVRALRAAVHALAPVPLLGRGQAESPAAHAPLGARLAPGRRPEVIVVVVDVQAPVKVPSEPKALCAHVAARAPWNRPEPFVAVRAESLAHRFLEAPRLAVNALGLPARRLILPRRAALAVHGALNRRTLPYLAGAARCFPGPRHRRA